MNNNKNSHKGKIPMQATVHSKRNRIISYLVGAFIIVGLLYKGAQVMWGEHYLEFFKGMARNPLQVGAFSPCSTFVCKEITKYVGKEAHHVPLRILEVGGGSGVFTTQLEKILANRSGDYIVDVIEIDPEYCQILQKRFAANDHFKVHCINVLDFVVEQPYDYIISSIPFTTIDQKIVEQILAKYKTAIRSGGILSYVEHMWLPDIKEIFLTGAAKQQYKERRAMMKQFNNEYLFETEKVYSNITPLYVYHLRIK